MYIGQIGTVGRLGLTPTKGVAYRIILDGLIWERVTDDATGEFVFDDATGAPVYAQVIA